MLNATSSPLLARRDGTPQLHLVRRYARLLRETGAAKRPVTPPNRQQRPPASGASSPG